jgi:hypothetical protein
MWLVRDLSYSEGTFYEKSRLDVWNFYIDRAAVAAGDGYNLTREYNDIELALLKMS